ncbi:MAG: hypothetical protein J2P36_22175 [Ktedonobacteraceae bacterium]|nr:hypothetical protein [Ktedonobacteraceae bacterium]
MVDADVAGEEWDEDALYETRPPSSVRRYRTTGEQATVPAPISSSTSVPIRRASAVTTGSQQHIGSSRKPGETAPVRRPAPRPQQQQPETAEEKEPS